MFPSSHRRSASRSDCCAQAVPGGAGGPLLSSGPSAVSSLGQSVRDVGLRRTQTVRSAEPPRPAPGSGRARWLAGFREAGEPWGGESVGVLFAQDGFHWLHRHWGWGGGSRHAA